MFINDRHYIIRLKSDSSLPVISTIGNLFEKSAVYQDGGCDSSRNPCVTTPYSPEQIAQFLEKNGFHVKEIELDRAYYNMAKPEITYF
ncbi:MAG: hypothetical protein ACT4OY_01255 [Alphaproteobacteria bacterium]